MRRRRDPPFQAHDILLAVFHVPHTTFVNPYIVPCVTERQIHLQNQPLITASRFVPQRNNPPTSITAPSSANVSAASQVHKSQQSRQSAGTSSSLPPARNILEFAFGSLTGGRRSIHANNPAPHSAGLITGQQQGVAEQDRRTILKFASEDEQRRLYLETYVAPRVHTLCEAVQYCTDEAFRDWLKSDRVTPEVLSLGQRRATNLALEQMVRDLRAVYDKTRR